MTNLDALRFAAVFEHELFRTIGFFLTTEVRDGIPIETGSNFSVGISQADWNRRIADPSLRSGVYLDDFWLVFQVALQTEFVGDRRFAFQAYQIEPDGSLAPVPYPPVFRGDQAVAELPYDGPELRYNFNAEYREYLQGSLIRRFYLPRLGWYRFVLYLREPLPRLLLPAERWVPIAETEVFFECEP